jgi:membrane fusion protein (multidrug efflux system)
MDESRSSSHDQLEPRPGSHPVGGPRRFLIPGILSAGVALILIAGAWLHHHAAASVNKVALASSPKPVTVVRSQSAMYRPEHRYVGTLRPWVEAKIGPQFIAAYVNTVLVRPGAVVTRNEVLGTLDCRDASARSRAINLQARSIQAEQLALSAQTQRMTGLLDGGYIAVNEVDQNSAQSNSEQAKLEAERARLVDAELSVGDCILRAPFDGDVGERWVDPGAFVRPGDPIVSIVDRDVVRLVVDVPEGDYASVAPGTEVEVHLLAVDQDLRARIARRSPSADAATRTVHTELDIPDPDHRLPVNTTAEVRAGIGLATPATRIPLIAADLSQDKAKLVTVSDSIAHVETLVVLGEAGGDLYVKPSLLAAGAEVVLEGRAALNDQDRVDAKEAETPPVGNGDPATAPGGTGPDESFGTARPGTEVGHD